LRGQWAPLAGAAVKPMPVSCHFQGCKALLRIVKRRYIKYRYHAFAFLWFIPIADERAGVQVKLKFLENTRHT